MLEDLGNCVKIHDTVIPAVNIQVEDFPRVINGEQYGIYFEVLFEDGSLWNVHQQWEDDYISLDVFPHWGQIYQNDLDSSTLDYAKEHYKILYQDWVSFASAYLLKRAGLDLIRKIHWSKYGEWAAA